MSPSLVIVESPTKAKTIKKFLGKDFIVESSMGHIRDLPTSEIGIDIEGNFEPHYIIPKEKSATVKKLKEALKEANDLYIATDEDREGEAIGWHLLEALKVKNPENIKRIVFHEITEGAIKEAIAHPRTLDQHLIDAQQARRVLDRLVGYTLSPFLWKKVYRGLSAGRVQSVAVRLIVDREREIQAFKAEEYWTITAKLQTKEEEVFDAEFKLKDSVSFVPTSEKETMDIVHDIDAKDFSVESIETKEVKKTPPPPFTTSTLQQDAARKLGFSVKQTMVVAQQLYEGLSLGKGEGSSGLITYMRTDSVNLSEKALKDAKEVIQKLYGREYTLSSPRTYQTKSKGAQEAHEAIRPTEMSRTPQSLAGVLDDQQLKLYTLIWNRTVATQMAGADLKRVGANIVVSSTHSYTFRATGQTILFDGFLRLYLEGKEDEDMEREQRAGEGDGEKYLPELSEGEKLAQESVIPEQHFTKPPARYTEASLVKKLEEEGIGRPSTYAPTISTIQQRGYIRKEGKQLAPEDIAFTVTDLLAEHFTDIVDLQFTAKMETKLDDIAEGKEEWVPFLRDFYTPFSLRIKEKTTEVKKEDVMGDRILGTDPETGLEVFLKTGRFGTFVQLGAFDKTASKGKKKKGEKDDNKPKAASLLKGMKPDTVTLDEALALLAFPKTFGKTDAGDPIEFHLGRFGPYLKAGAATASVRDVHPFEMTKELAKELLANGALQKLKSAPLASFGKDPTSGGEISLKEGRFGPYITDGKTNVSLPKSLDVSELSPEKAIELLEKKRSAPPSKWKGRWAKKKE